MKPLLLSSSDVLTQSQTACRISRAFARGRDTSPVEFVEVEQELNSLGGALKSVAEALWEDGSILSQADDGTKDAINTILQSIRQTLVALERFVDRYQVIQKKDTGHGFVVERVWSQIVLANYKTFKWTFQGSDIRELRKLLQMYMTCTESITHAVQSRSPEKLAETVVQIALVIAPVHEQRTSGFGGMLDEVHRVILEISNGTPYFDAQKRRIESPSTRASPSISNSSMLSDTLRTKRKSPGKDSSLTAGFTSDRDSKASDDSQQATDAGRTYDLRSSPQTYHSISESRDLSASPQDSAYGGESSSRTSWRRDSATLPALFQTASDKPCATASDIRNLMTEGDVAPPIPNKTHSITERRKFEKHLLRNAAILCDVRGRLIEYAHHNPEITDIRYNVAMKLACKECRILVIRNRENREYGGTKVITSVWCLSDDDETRIQQKLAESQETVPYCSYFEPEKVSLQGTTEEGGQILLKFHSQEWGAILKAERSTNWVNYSFVNEADAVAFQSAVFGRLLLASFATTKTTVIHDGLKGAFTFEEQFANIEMLRLWEDDGLETPGAAGGVMALMHISSNFGEGWARWWINNSRQNVRIKEEGSKFVKIRGIDVTVAKPGATTRQAERAKFASLGGVVNSKAAEKDAVLKKVGGIKIEFMNEEERNRFVAAVRKAQASYMPLPEL
ncbi:hypothetical protein CERZMDRAFT_49143 [Cercospora zeae-maydis SCOH1-5]|uniref:Uncharacterized protein n=1 Tax=Cercospora zeae-maydis SCOH1-5 TaxID=717836 RepID=A0A6A6F782_9PEZI|nr:hypothetical protein CERZMDRAFT_49143 [Cercospora zeae-maydis SCOH1-5]